MAVAAAAVNAFKTITKTVGISTVGVYTAPIAYTGVILLAQVTNIGDVTETISFGYRRSGVDTPIINNLPIPANDTVNLLSGKLVVETNNSLTLVGSSAVNLEFLCSILETSNL
tara:strand:+ start:2505 stop:2846 length:342 start_codon:yes stop_codon:yes gene_type:complete